jgi:Protein of unknown function (DUF4235)
MSRLLFAPLSIAAGIAAGLLGRKLFEAAWGLVDDEEAPDAEHREIRWPKLIAALAVEGAIFRLVKGLADHGARRMFERATGVWPGEEAPEPE